MNKNIKTTLSTLLIAVALLLTGSQQSFGQQVSRAKQASIREKAQKTMNSYRTYATLSSDERIYSFLQLFTSGNASVFNDLLGLTKSQSALTSENYAEKLGRSGVKSTRVVVKDINYGVPTNTGGKWRITVNFKKELSYTAPNGANISSRDYLKGKDFNLKAVLVYDEKSDRCLIERISDANSKGTGGGSDGLLKIRAHYGLGLGNAFSLSGGGSGLDAGKSSGSDFGVEVGYQFLELPEANLKLSAFGGLGISTYSLKDLGYTGDYSYNTTSRDADVDGDLYRRQYSSLSVNQTVKLTDITIPLYVDGELGFNEMFSAYADLGLRLNFNMSNSLSSGASADRISGVYNDYHNSTLDGNWGFNGFTKNHATIDAVKEDIDGLSGLTADLMAGLGVRFSIPNAPVQVDLGVSYLMGLGSVISSGAAQVGDDIKSPIIYNTVATEAPYANTEHVRSLTDAFDSVKRKQLRLNIGVIYKF